MGKDDPTRLAGYRETPVCPPPAPPESGRGEGGSAMRIPSLRRGEGQGEGEPTQPGATASGRVLLYHNEGDPWSEQRYE